MTEFDWGVQPPPPCPCWFAFVKRPDGSISYEFFEGGRCWAAGTADSADTMWNLFEELGAHLGVIKPVLTPLTNNVVQLFRKG